MRAICIFLSLLSSIVVFPQITTKETISNKIKSVHKTVYENIDGPNEYTEKKYYSTKGYDSVKYIDTVLVYTCSMELNNEGRIRRLTRHNKNGEIEELEIYKYNSDGSYTIQLIEQGAGETLLSKFDKKGNCILEVYSGTDTIVYINDSNGRMQKAQTKEDGRLKTVMTATFDSKGFPLSINISGTDLSIARYKNNDLGLPVEISVYKVSGGKEELVERNTFKYEFY